MAPRSDLSKARFPPVPRKPAKAGAVVARRHSARSRRPFLPTYFVLDEEISRVLESPIHLNSENGSVLVLAFKINEEPGGYEVELHGHSHAELVWVAAGRQDYLVDGRKIRLEAGRGIWVPPERLHARASVGDSRILGFQLRFQTFDPASGASAQATKILSRKSIVRLLSRIPGELREKRPGWVLAARSWMVLGLTDFLRAYLPFAREVAPSRAARHPAVAKALAHIEANLHGDLDPDRVAAAASVSSRHLNRLFLDAFDKTCSALILEKRLGAAFRALSSAGLTVREAAKSAGIHDMSYFSKVFKRHFHLLPSELRKDLR